MNEIVIENRKIGLNHPPLIIAEIGINHGGDIGTAFEMVDAAWKSGAEVIKHQTHIVEDEMTSRAKNVIPGNSSISIYEIMEQCALDEDDEILLKNYVESRGMIFLSTPFSRTASDRLAKMGVSAYKIGSGECNNYPLIEHIAAYGKPMIVSTGMNNIDSVRKTVAILEKFNIAYALLHTTNLYPTPAVLVRLGAMRELQKEFPNAVIGLSDHTISNRACFAATALGACILERHFTDKMERSGPDIINSMDPIALKELLIGSAEIALMRGGRKEASEEEQVTINFAFSTVVSIKPIKKGELFNKQNTWVKRPGTGSIKAEFYNSVIGKIANKDIDADQHIEWDDMDG
ncbi:MAG: N-acetylneuraminate synthase family protein [Salinispira sp.]